LSLDFLDFVPGFFAGFSGFSEDFKGIKAERRKKNHVLKPEEKKNMRRSRKRSRI